MNKTRHSFLLTAAGLVLLLIIAIVVQTRAPLSPRDVTSATIGSPLSFNNAYSPQRRYVPPAQANTSAPYESQAPGEPITRSVTPNYNLPTLDPAVTQAEAVVTKITQSDSSFDFNEFMQKLSSSAPKAEPLPPSQLVPTQQYSYIPEQLFFPSTNKQTAQNSTQQDLHTYGNAAGALIQRYEQMYSNDSEIVQNYFDNRSNTAHVIAMRQLGDGLRTIGMDMLAMTTVPSPANAVHKALADSYIDIGQKLAAIPDAVQNTDIVSAISTYNSAVEIYAKNYTNMVLMFSQNNVIFSPEDPGSAFMFSKVSL